MAQELTPNEDSANNTITIEKADSQQRVDLNNFTSIEMDIRDKDQNLLAKYNSQSSSNQAYSTSNTAIELRQPNQDTIEFDIYGQDTVSAAKGEFYANIFLFDNNRTNYQTFKKIIPFVTIGEMTRKLQ